MIRLAARFRRGSVHTLSLCDCARFPHLPVSRRGDGAIGSSPSTPLPRPVGVDCWIVGAVFFLPHRRVRVAVVSHNAYSYVAGTWYIFPRFLTFYPFLFLFLLKYSYPELPTETHAFKTSAPVCCFASGASLDSGHLPAPKYRWHCYMNNRVVIIYHYYRFSANFRRARTDCVGPISSDI